MNPAKIYLRVSRGEASAALALVAAFPDGVVLDDPFWQQQTQRRTLH